MTNYHYLMNLMRGQPGSGLDLLVGDEAHLAESIFRDHRTLRYATLGSRLGIGLIEHQKAINFLEKHISKYYDDEREAAKLDLEEDDNDVVEAKLTEKEKRNIRIKRLYRGIETLTGRKKDDWICVIEPKKSNLLIIPIRNYWPAVRGLYLSATIFDPMVTEPFGRTAYIRLPSTFPAANRPVISLDGGRLSFKATPETWTGMYNLLDTVISQMGNRQGIIHTPSYKMAETILTTSRYSAIMETHGSGGRDEAVANFKLKKKQILVSPAVAEGVDFPGDECEWQIIPKLPFPDLQDIVSSSIYKATPGLTDVTVARKIVQMAGRGVRSETDTCTTFILDTNFRWFYRNNVSKFPQWFRDAVSTG